MFISNTEKTQIHNGIKSLAKMVSDLNINAVVLAAKVKALSSGQPRKKQKGMSPEGKAKMSAMMKERHAKRKLEAQAAKESA